MSAATVRRYFRHIAPACRRALAIVLTAVLVFQSLIVNGAVTTALADELPPAAQPAGDGGNQDPPVLTVQANNPKASLADYVDKSKTTIEVSSDNGATWQTYYEGMEVSGTAKVRMHLAYVIPNSLHINSGDVLNYKLPSEKMTFDQKTGNIDAGTGNPVGTYNIDGKELDLTFNQNLGSDVSGWTWVTGNLNDTGNNHNNGGPVDITFPGVGTLNLNVKGNQSVSVKKGNGTFVSANADGTCNYVFTLQVDSKGTNHDVSLTDTMGALMSMTDGKVTAYTDASCSTEAQGVTVKTTGAAAGSTGFTATIDQMADGQTLYLRYTVKASPDKVVAAKEDWQTPAGANNSVTCQSREDTEPAKVNSSIDAHAWNVEKTGTFTSNPDHPEKGTITWQLNIDAGDNPEAVLKDVLGDHISAPTGNIKVWKTDNKWNVPTEPTATISWDQLKNGYTMSGNTFYRLEYTTEVDNVPQSSGNQVYENTASVTPKGNKTPVEKTGSVKVGPANVKGDIEKQVLSNDSDPVQNNTIKWQETVSATTSVENPVVTDTVASGHKLDGSSVVVKEGDSTLSAGSDYTISTSDTGFTIKFTKAMDAGDTYTIAYTTQITNSNQASYSNTANFKSDETELDDSTATYNRPVSHLKKSGTEYNNGRQLGYFFWTLDVSRLDSESSVSISDTLPTNQKLVAGSFKAVSVSTGNEVAGVTCAETGAATQDQNNTLAISFDEAARAVLKNGDVKITYTTTYRDFSAMLDPSNPWVWHDYTNTATLSVDNKDEAPQTATVSTQNPSLVEKTSDYSEATAPYVNYTVKINSSALDLDPNSDSLTLTDTLGTALSLSMDQVKVSTDGGSTFVPITEMGDGYGFAYDPSTRTSTFKVPDQVALVLSYPGRVMLKEGQTFPDGSATNTATLSLGGDRKVEVTTEEKGEVKKAGSGIVSTLHSLSIYKYAKQAGSNDASHALAGAKFKVEQLTCDDQWSVTGKQTVTWTNSGTTYTADENTLISGKSGYTWTISGLNADVVYKVSEITPPDGYQADSTSVYVVFPGKDTTTDYSKVTITDGDQTAQLQVAAADKTNNGTALQMFTAYMGDTVAPRDTGGFTLSKAVDGNAATDADKSTAYTFTITFTGISAEDAKAIKCDNTSWSIEANDTAKTAVATVEVVPGTNANITNIPVGVKYTVSEASVEGFETTNTVTPSGDQPAVMTTSGVVAPEQTVAKDDNTAIAFTNTKNTYGSLKLTKLLAGNGASLNDEFEFTVALSGTGATEDTVTYGGRKYTKQADNTYSTTVEIKGNQSVTLTGIPNGATYTVTEIETNTDGYQPSFGGDGGNAATGQIKGDKTQSVEVTNTLNVEGPLTITKTTVNASSQTNADAKVADQTFKFTVNIQLPAGVKPAANGYTMTVGDNTTKTISADSFTNDGATIEVTLKDRQSAKVDGLPKGTTYSVVEQMEADDVLGYVSTSTGATGSIQSKDGATAAFTNVYSVGNLTVSKQVEGNDVDRTKPFSIDIQLTSGDESTLNGEYDAVGSQTGSQTKVKFTGGKATVQLKDGEAITIKGIPAGTSYSVSETKQDDGYEPSVTGGSGQITENETSAAVVTNTRNTYGGLSIAKEVAGNAQIADATFTFTVRLDDPAGIVSDWTKYQVTRDGIAPVAFGANGEANVTLAAGQTAYVLGLPNGVHYTITEDATSRADYDSTVGTNTDATIKGVVENGAVSADQINDANKAVITNTRNRSCDLTVEKVLAGKGATEGGPFVFTVTLTMPDQSAGFVAPTGFTSSDNGKTYTGSVTLTGSTEQGKSVYTIKNLPVGTTYTVTEESVDGFTSVATGAEGTLGEKGARASFTNTTVEQTGTAKYRPATFAKTNAAGAALEGATYTLYSDPKCTQEVRSYTVGKDGATITPEDLKAYLPQGENGASVTMLYLKETTAPAGYTLNDNAAVVRITRTEESLWQGEGTARAYVTSPVYTATIANTARVTFSDAQTSVYFAKVKDGEPDKLLGGAHLQILDANKNVVKQGDAPLEWDTKEGEAHQVSGLMTNTTYYLHETVAPNGLMLSTTDVEFQIDEQGNLVTAGQTVNNKNHRVLLMTDDAPHVSIRKTNSAGDGLAGAHVTITDKNGALVKEWDTVGRDYRLDNLATGEVYTFTEAAAPTGYALAKSFNFSIDADGKITVEGDDTRTDVKVEGSTIFVADMFKVRLRKVARGSASNQQLEQCTLSVLDENHKVVTDVNGTELTWTTTSADESHEVILPAGNYFLHEVKAPDGYDLTSDVPFAILEDGTLAMSAYSDDGMSTSTVVAGKVTDENAPVVEIADWHYNEVKVSKTDIGGTPIKDAELTITGTDVDGNKIMWGKDGTVGRDEKSPSYTWHSKTEGPETLTLVPGTYTIKEVAAPEGYVVVSDFSFTIDKDGKVTLANGTSSGEVELLEDGTIRIKDAKAPAKPQQPDQKAKPATPQQPDQKAKPTMPAALAQTGDLFMNVAPFAMGAATSLGAGLGLRKRRRKHRGKHMR